MIWGPARPRKRIGHFSSPVAAPFEPRPLPLPGLRGPPASPPSRRDLAERGRAAAPPARLLRQHASCPCRSRVDLVTEAPSSRPRRTSLRAGHRLCQRQSTKSGRSRDSVAPLSGSPTKPGTSPAHGCFQAPRSSARNRRSCSARGPSPIPWGGSGNAPSKLAAQRRSCGRRRAVGRSRPVEQGVEGRVLLFALCQ